MHTVRRAAATGLRGPASRRAAAAAIALFVLLGVGHVLPALHFALVAHSICAEHGELLHEPAPAPSAEAVGSRSSAREPMASQHAEHEHEHCGVLALPDSFDLPSSASWREPSLLGEPIVCSSHRELAAHNGIALLFEAPKLAPPV